MQPVYASAIFFRPPNSRAVPGPPYWFLAQQKTLGPTLQLVDEGYLIWDTATVCGYVVVRRREGSNALNGPIRVAETYGQVAVGGSASFSVPPQAIFDRSQVIIGPVGQDPNLTPFEVDGISHGRGNIDYVASVASSGAIGGAEALLLVGNVVTYYNNRAFDIIVSVNVTAAAANAANAQVLRVRVGGLVGTVERTWVQRCVVAGSESISFTLTVVRTAGTNLVSNLVLTGQAVTNNFIADVAGNSPYSMEITDVGAASRYPNANVLI
jgi:hypothetical protein